MGLAAESCLQYNKRRRPVPGGRELDGERRPGRVHQVPESGGHASPDEAQHPPLQGDATLQPLRCLFAENGWRGESSLTGVFCLPTAGVPVRRVHTRAAAVRRQGVHAAAAASQRGLQLQLLAPGGHQGAGPHHAAADLRAGWVANFSRPVNGVFPSNEDQHFFLKKTICEAAWGGIGNKRSS